MAYDFRIVISGATLGKKAYQDIIKELKSFGDSLKIPINVDTTKLNKAVQSIKLIANEQGEITQTTQKYNVELGKTLVLKTKIRNVIDAEGKLVKDINGNLVKEEITTSEILINQKEINKEKLKEINYTIKQRQEAEKLAKVNASAYQNIINQRLGIFDKPSKSAQESFAVFEPQITKEFEEMAKTRNKQFESWFLPNLDKGRSQINQTTSAFNDLFQKAEKSRVGLTALEKKVLDLNPAMKNVRKHTISFGEAISIALERTLQWATAMTVFYGALRQIQYGVKYIIELDSALNQIRIVTGQTQVEVNALGRSYNELAKEMRVTTTEIAKAAVEFYRQGLSQNEVNERLQDTIKYAKISNLAFDESAKIITATANSMELDTQRVIDVFSYLGDATATGSDEIGKAFQKVGGTAGALNLEFEKVASWIAVISSRTRESSETIGNSVKSILARLQQLREKGFIETEEGNLLGANQVSKALAESQIKLMDEQTGQFRDFGVVIDELGAKWDTLSKNQQAYISTVLAGTYQQSRFMTLMDGYSESVKLYEESLNSAGSATEKFSIYQESAQAKIDSFIATLEGLWQNTLNADSIKAIVSLGTALVSLIDKIGLVTFAVLGLNVALAGMGKMSKINESIILLMNSLKSFRLSALTTTAVVNGLKVALATMWPFLATAAIYGVVKAFDHFYVSLNEQKQIVSTLTTEYKELQEELNKLKEIKNPTDEQQKYIALLERELTVKENLLKTEIKRAAYKEVLGTGVFGEGLSGRISTDIGAIEGLGQRKARLENQLLSIDIDKDPAKFEKIKSQLDFVNEQINKVELSLIKSKKTIEEYKDKLGEETPKEFDNLIKKIDEALPKIQAYNTGIKENTETIKENADVQLEYTNQTEKFNKQIEESAQNVDFLNRTLDELSEYHSLSGKTISELIDKNSELIKYLDNEAKLREEIKKKIKEEENAFKQGIANKLKASADFVDGILAKNPKLLKGLIDAYGQDVKNFETFLDLKDKANAALIAKLGADWAGFYGNQARSLDDVLKDLAFIESGKQGPVASSKEALEAVRPLYNFKKALDKMAEDAVKNIPIGGKAKGSDSKSGSSLRAESSVSEALIEKDRYAQLNYELEKTNGLLEQNKALQENVKEQQRIKLLYEEVKLLKQKQQNLHAINQERRKERDELAKILSAQGVKFTGSGDSLFATNLQEVLQRKIDQVNAHRGDKNKTYYNQLKKQYDDLTKVAERFIKLQTKEIPQAGIEWQKLQKDINEVHQEFQDMVADILEQQKSIYLEGLKKEEESILDSIKKQIEDVTERYEEQIKKQEEKLKLLDEEIDKENRLLELKQIQDEIDKIKQNKNVEFITEQGERILTYDTAQVANLEQQRAELERQYAQENARKNIEDEIERLQEAKDAEIKILEEELAKKEEYYNKLIETDTKKWESLITSAQEGTLTFSELMDKWYKDVLKKLKQFGEDVEEQTAKIGQAISFGGSSGSGGSKRVKVGADGKAPKGLSAGTIVETNGGDYLITDVKDDGTYESIKLPKYHEGGIVGGSSNKMIELANKLFNVKPGEILNKSLVGELQIPPQNIVKNFIPNLQNLIRQQAPSNGGTIFNINEVNVRANNPQEFVNALRHQLIAVT